MGAMRVRTRGEVVIIETRVPELRNGQVGFKVERLYGTRPKAKGEATGPSETAFDLVVGMLGWNHLNPPSLSDLYERALERISTDKPTDRTSIYRSAMLGASSKIDRWTRIMSLAELKELSEPQKVGVGIMLGEPKKGSGVSGLLLMRVFPNSPAAKAGVRKGDRLLKVDGHEVSDAKQAVTHITAGAEGRLVSLTVEREGKVLEFSMRREAYDRGTVTSAVTPDGVGVVRLEVFEKGATEAIDTQLAQLEAKHGGPLRGLVLDLRDNPGGLVTEAIGVLQRFEGREAVLAQFKYPTQKRQLFLSNPAKARWSSVPLIVLVNGRSASASELVAGSLKGRRAVIMGARTFGKGVQQVVVPLPDDTALSFTNAQFFTPLTSPHEVGVEPDVAMKEAEEPRPEDGEGVDVVLREAIKALQKQGRPAN